MMTIDELLSEAGRVPEPSEEALARGYEVLTAALATGLTTDNPGAQTRRAVRPLPRRARHRMVLAAVFAVAVAAGVLMPVLWQKGRGRAYAVTPQDSGAIRIEANWPRLHDLTGLQEAIDAAGARTRIYVTGDAPMPSLPACAATTPTDQELNSEPRVPQDAFEVPGTDDAHLLLIVRPSLLPTGTTLIATVNYSKPDNYSASTSFFLIFTPPPNNCAPMSDWFISNP